MLLLAALLRSGKPVVHKRAGVTLEVRQQGRRGHGSILVLIQQYHATCTGVELDGSSSADGNDT